MSDKDNKSDESSDRAPSNRTLTPSEKLMLEAIKEDVLKAIDRADDFSKAMITLVSGFFIAYFALFKFLGVETLSATSNTAAIIGLIIAPILFILSLILFVLSANKKNPKYHMIEERLITFFKR